MGNTLVRRNLDLVVPIIYHSRGSLKAKGVMVGAVISIRKAAYRPR